MSKAREWSRGWQMPGPRAGQNLQTPHPGTDKAGKCPAVARGKRAQVELTDAQHTFNRFLFIFIFLFIFFFLHVQPMQGNQPYLAYTSLPVQ